MALLMGSLLLFAALAAVMFSTRRFDWYQLKQGEMALETAGE
jgi:inner membrane protein involved in colicin E2 resistance